MHRPAIRLAGLLACAAVPVALVAGCSSSGSDDAKSSAAPSSSSSGAAEPSVAPARYHHLPDPCDGVSQDTVKDLLPKVKSASGDRGKSSDTDARGYCSWSSADENGVKGTQYRWLDVSYQRYDSEQAIGSGAQRAGEAYTKQVQSEKSVDGAKKLSTTPVKDLGDDATAITYESSKDGSDFRNTTVVARTANVVVTVHYDGAGLAGAKDPDSADLLKDVQTAAKDAVAAVAKAQK
ncbi:DUF3558 family protein [Streptomyces sp. NPDC059740]|uniref:DUF3558 family protein n=1 Tax=Streptomyces sp. NPDC059740 TaxID=3346926 RepID=UPI003650687F